MVNHSKTKIEKEIQDLKEKKPSTKAPQLEINSPPGTGGRLQSRSEPMTTGSTAKSQAVTTPINPRKDKTYKTIDEEEEE